jgi:hypothetical protein
MPCIDGGSANSYFHVSKWFSELILEVEGRINVKLNCGDKQYLVMIF